MEYSIDVAVIGAGVIGLAVARALSLKGREVVVLEECGSIGTGNSSRNSEVLHAGIYYPKDSLKAKLCVQGKNLIYNYCKQNSVSYNQCGKLIIATAPKQISELESIENKAVENGVLDLRWINSTELQKIEPEIRGVAALFSPSTGLIDTHALMLSFQSELEEYGGVVAFQSPVLGGIIKNNSIRLSIGGPEPSDLNCHTVINCGGIHAQQIASRIEGFPGRYVPETHYAKGNYFVLNRVAPFRHLIYPVPDEAGLGIHLTLDLSGRARFGPDVEWI
ncbi:MAG: NAD(P)/FAD-dependent oxidoreductase, partial [Pseudomonadota bacterium]|nr:NAD(P)/FAD-dependent oxidoreductase [Pseudomonadota bacterium]